MDERSRNLFHKEESELSEYERMMLSILAEKEEAEKAAAAETNAPVEEAPAEEVPAGEAPVEEAPVEEAPAGEAPVEEAPAGEAPVEEAPAEEAPAEEAPVEEAPAGEAPVEEAPVEEAPAEPDDSDVKIAPAKIETGRQPIPLLTEEANPELEPVVVSRPTIQFMSSIEREKKIARKVRRHRRRSGVVVVALCVALMMVAFLYNGLVNKSWGLLEKPEPTPEPTPDIFEIAPTPEPTPEITPEPIKVHRYVIERGDLSWTAAQDQCLASGGYLAVINTQSEFNEITALADEKGVECLWIGCHRSVGEYVWENGEKVDRSVDPTDTGMALWAKEEPSFIDRDDGTEENYLMLWKHDGGWSYWDSRNDPAGEFWGWRGRIAYVCEFEE